MLAFAWRRRGLIVVSLIVGLALGYLYYVKQDPVYQSSIEVLVVEDQSNLPIDGLESRTSSGDMHITLMRSQKVIEKAIKVGELAELETLRTSDNPAARVLSNLRISGGGGAKGSIIRLSYESPDPVDCPLVLQAVVTAYEQFLSEVYDDDSKDAIDLIGKAKDQLGEQISELEKEYRKMLDESPLLVTGETAHNIHETRLQTIEGVRSAMVVENSTLQAKIDALQAAIKRGSSREALNMVVGNIETPVGNIAADVVKRDQLFPLLLQHEMLLDNHGPDHPKVKSILKQIDFVRNHLDKHKPVKLDTNPAKESTDFYIIYLESLKEQISINNETIAEMTQLFEKERKSAKSLTTYKVQEETYRSELGRKTRLFDVVLKRLEEISLVQDRGGVELQTIHPASRGRQIEPDLKSIMVQAGILSLLVGLSLAFVVDSADRRFRSPDEIRDQIGVPVIGHIPVIPGTGKPDRKGQTLEDGTLPTEIRTVHAPRGRIAEAYRAVRTAMYFSTRGGGHQVFQVTSPTPGDGKSTLAANLAVSVANSGKQVLLIDADFRRPRCHKLLALENEIGIAAVIDGSAELADAVQETQVEKLSVLTCGKRPKHPSELLTSKSFEDLLELVREKYELVILDSPPVLAVTDPLNVAPRVDGVLVILRLNKNARNVARRTLSSLEEVGANVLGIIVNGVGQDQGSYGYGKYGYSYGYGRYGYAGYGYRYGYRYRKDYGYGDNAYYGDDAAEVNTKSAATATTTHKGNGDH